MSEDVPFDRKKRIRAFVRLFLGITRDFWKEARIARKHGMAVARERMSARHRRRAIQFRETALEMGGVPVKLGQFFSTRVDIMPYEYIEELAMLQDTVPAVPFAQIKDIIEAEFGRPLSEVYMEFAPDALAAASLAQVHLARLPDGQEVAVKIQRPGIDKLSDIDLATFSYLMDGLARFTKFGRQTNIPMVVEEFTRVVGDELDFVREATYAERFRQNFLHDPRIFVPRVFWDYTTTRVLTLEAVDAIKISNYEAIEAAGIDRTKTAQIVIDVFLKQVLEDGFFHADPHPGNLFVEVGPDGPIITFVDFGMIGEITPDMKVAIKDAVIGIAHRDSQQILNALRDLRFLRPGADVRGVKNAVDWVLNNYSGLQASNLSFEDVGEIQTDIEQILHDQPVTLPAHLAFLGKTLSMTMGVATGLDPHIDLIESTRPYVSRLTRQQDWTNILLKEAKTIGRQLLDIPKQLHETLEAAASGRLRVKIDSQDIVDAIDRSNRNRDVWSTALFSGLVLLGGVWLISQAMTAIGYIFVVLGFVSFMAGYTR